MSDQKDIDGKLASVDEFMEMDQFNETRVEALINDLKGLDKLVYQRLTDAGSLTPMALRQAAMEMMTSGDNFVSMATKHGFLSQDELVEISLELDPSELSAEELIEPSVPPKVLRDNKVMLSAITAGFVYLSTLSSQRLAERALKPYFPHHRFYFIPARVMRIMDYLDKVEKYSRREGSLLDIVLRKSIREKNSDIHVYPQPEGYNIKVRHLGQLYVEHVGNTSEYLQLVTRAKTSAGLDATDRRSTQDGRYYIDFNGRRINLRVSTCPVIGGKESLVIRILDPEQSSVNFYDLGITKDKEIADAFRSRNGVVLICGVTGSGKTTTMTSAMRWIMDRYSQAISTIEDPVENELNDVKQTQVDHRGGLTFPRVLRSLLRQDPDNIGVGEIRDIETAQIMFQGAETGHLLFGTIHVGDILGVLERLETLEVDRDKILDQLRGILVQELIRVVCPDCRGAGCDECRQRGYVGRTVVSEAVYLRNREDVKKLLQAREDGTRWWDTIIEDAYRKYREGITDRREMVANFGPEFEFLETEHATADAEKVLSGDLDVDTFLALYPKHDHLLASRAV